MVTVARRAPFGRGADLGIRRGVRSQGGADLEGCQAGGAFADKYGVYSVYMSIHVFWYTQHIYLYIAQMGMKYVGSHKTIQN